MRLNAPGDPDRPPSTTMWINKDNDKTQLSFIFLYTHHFLQICTQPRGCKYDSILVRNVFVYCCVGGAYLIFLLWLGSKHILHYTVSMIHIANNEIARWRNAKRTKTLVDEMRSKDYDPDILNVTRLIKSNNGKTLYGIFGLTARGLAEVGFEVSSDAIRKKSVKKRRQIIIRRKSEIRNSS